MSTAPLTEPGGAIWPGNADDTAVLIYTSGTTGKPKGAELSHFLLYMNCTISGQLFGARPDDVTLAVLPFFHVFGLSSVINVSVRYGGCLSVVPRFEPGGGAGRDQRRPVLGDRGVPTMLHALAQLDVSGRDLSRLRVTVSGGASLPEEVHEEIRSQVRHRGARGVRAVGDRQHHVLQPSRRPKGAVGRKADLGRADARRGRRRPADAAGQGPDRRDPDPRAQRDEGIPQPAGGDTPAALKGGWLHTGDLGYVDEDGFYFIVDRTKDLVIRGGYNVYPREIEEVLYAHPGISEAAVIGKPDERLGEEVVAVVVLRAGADLSEQEVIAYCQERLAAYKYPREVRFRSELPKGPSGKILKIELRDS